MEYIRQKNLKENQLFLDNLRMDHVRDSFFIDSLYICLGFRFEKILSDQLVLCFVKMTIIKLEKTSIIPLKGMSFILFIDCILVSRVERNTRYNKKLKAGQITPYVPERQRRLEEKKKQAERNALERERKRRTYELKKEEELFRKELRKIERELKREERIASRRKRPKTSKWTVFERTHSNPYQRLFKPRHTRAGERAAQNLFAK